jgi:MFS family permease
MPTQYARRSWGLFGLSLASFAVVMELPMIFTILPSIQLKLAPTMLQLHWVMCVYILLASVSLVTVWRLSDWIGRRWVLYIGLVVFGLSSLFCGLAASPGALILFRAFEGLGAAMILPNTISLICSMYPQAQRARPIRVWAGFNALGFAVGSVVGGVFSHVLGWNSVFYLLAILAAVSLLLCIPSVEESYDKKLREPVDVFGGVIFSLFLVSLVVAIVQGPAWGWGSLLSVLFFIVAAVALVAFASQEWRLKTPIIDLKLLRNRFYRSSIYASIALATAFYGGFFIMPFYLHLLENIPVDAVGFILLAVTIVIVAVQPLVKRLAKFANLKLLILLGLAFLIVSITIQAQFIVMDNLELVLFAFVLMGFGIGIIWGASRKVIFRLFENEENHLVTETLWSWQTASATVGLAIMGTIFRQSHQNQLEMMLSEHKLNVSMFQDLSLRHYLLDSAQIKSLFHDKGVAFASEVTKVYQQALDQSYIHAVWFSLGLALAAFIAIVVVKMVKDK